MPKKLLLQWIFLFCLIDYLDTLLITNDITENAEYGCKWSGGNFETGLTCTCQPHSKVNLFLNAHRFYIIYHFYIQNNKN